MKSKPKESHNCKTCGAWIHVDETCPKCCIKTLPQPSYLAANLSDIADRLAPHAAVAVLHNIAFEVRKLERDNIALVNALKDMVDIFGHYCESDPSKAEAEAIRIATILIT